jgi:hypothetical protein
MVEDPDVVGQLGGGHVQVPAAGAGEHPRPADGSLAVLGEEPLQAVLSLGAVDVDDVEADAAAQTDVGLRPPPPPFADLVEVGGGIVDAPAADAFGDAWQLAGQWQHRDAAPCVFQRPVARAVEGVGHRAQPHP